MKKLFVLVLTFLVTLSSFAQSSTEGKEFWVALTFTVTPPDKNHKQATDPYYKCAGESSYIAVSAKKKGTVITLTNPANPNWRLSYTTQINDEWHEFNTIPTAQWYPSDVTTIANFAGHADEINNYGIKVTATEDISVFAVLRADYGMDATNVLPVPTLQSKYMISDYPWPNINIDDDIVFSGPIISMATIVATEDNTVIDITPTSNTLNDSLANQTYQVTLNKGQTYYMIGKDGLSLGGSTIVARDNKPIAVFMGEPCTRVPAGVAARDCLYEQAMPVDYWGTEFVVTRSNNKDANIIGITALEDNTDITLGASIVTINRGQTYLIELQQNNPATNKASNLLHPLPQNQIFNLDALYIQTSCPCAVYSYDTGNSYNGKNTFNTNKEGDPSSVWIAPIQQSINHITFGTCHTNKTKKHNIDIVCETQYASHTSLSSNKRNNIPLAFTPVPNNTNYSFASMLLVNDEVISGENVFTLNNPVKGFVAHVYGHGEDESYAYSVGSSAVKRGIQVDEDKIENGSESSNTYCVNTPILFNAQVGTDTIKQAFWDMGDGVTFTDQSRISFKYSYDTPGWYDVAATVNAHKECPDTVYPKEYINVRIHVVRPDTFLTKKFICEGDTLNYGGKAYTEATTDTVTFDCDSVVIFQLEVGKKSSYTCDTIAKDSFVLAGTTYYKSGKYEATITNVAGCDSLITANVTVLACLHLEIGNPDSVICANEAEFRIPYNHTKGDIAAAYIENRGVRTSITPSPLDNAFVIPLSNFTADHYTNASIVVVDTLCGDSLRFPVSFDVLYPSSVFNQKWDNTLVLYNKDYNGGYDFKTYQWYKDGLPILGATEGFYVEEPLDQDSYYQVLLTRYDSVSGDIIELMTCPYYPVSKAAAPAKEAEKVLENGQLHIIKNNTRYSILGVEIRKQEY